jgi:hypothetical protein
MPRSLLRPARALIAALLLAAAGPDAQAPVAWLSAPQTVAPGVELFSSTDRSLVGGDGPVAIHLLKLDPGRVRLDGVLSNDEVAGAEPVDAIARRHQAIAAINGGFFNTRNGEPVSLLKVAGELVSDNTAVRGVVLIRSPREGRTELRFDQAAVRQAIAFEANGRSWTVPIDGVDTTRARGKLMLYTPAYHADTDTAANGVEFVLDGDPLAVTDVRVDAGRTPIPRRGAVLSYGGLDLPEPLVALTRGVEVKIETNWRSIHGLEAKHFDGADHVVNGAGLLRRDGQTLSNWIDVEALNPASFLDMRHPRTVIGVDRAGAIWLVVVDGRQPDRSIGMDFADLERLCDRLALRDALNLDGGGSTTMVVQGAIVNQPSDPAGPRPVSDAILVSLR